ncbi:MAG: hypothetical protein E6Q67_12870 [Roseateles sp.]|nr:MAG: hypothetical protein E6Q67_12870 [Roseateles sp.]
MPNKPQATPVNAMTFATELIKTAAGHVEAGRQPPPFVLQDRSGAAIVQFELRITHFGSMPVKAV